MRVLITGNLGFIGAHLTRELREHGYRVSGHDRDDGDLTRAGVFQRALGRHMPEQVIHLAAQVGRVFGEDDLVHTVNANATMTTLVAKACGEAGIPVLYASTSEVYGDRGGVVTCEDEHLTPFSHLAMPRNLYGLSKRWGEEALRLYAPDGLRIVRLSMPYGPGAPPGRGRRAMDNLIHQAQHRKPMTVHRDAERSWCWAGDTVRGIRLVMEGGEHEVYNIGRDDQPITMHQLALTICELTSAPVDLIRLVDPPRRQTLVKRLSTSRLRALGWRPTVNLDEGLRRMLPWIAQFGWDELPVTREHDETRIQDAPRLDESEFPADRTMRVVR